MKIAIAIALSLSVLSAQAAKWIALDETTDPTISLDFESVRVIGPDVIQFWTKNDYKKPTRTYNGVLYDRTLVQNRVNCNNQTRENFYMVVYAKGKALAQIPAEGVTHPIIPETAMADIAGSLCAKLLKGK